MSSSFSESCEKQMSAMHTSCARLSLSMWASCMLGCKDVSQEAAPTMSSASCTMASLRSGRNSSTILSNRLRSMTSGGWPEGGGTDPRRLVTPSRVSSAHSICIQTSARLVEGTPCRRNPSSFQSLSWWAALLAHSRRSWPSLALTGSSRGWSSSSSSSWCSSSSSFSPSSSVCLRGGFTAAGLSRTRILSISDHMERLSCSRHST
mmetsp:Transcript_23139/g.65830  ORF Transcript_23139/g.65830 Transcript_23139/m.65830 type:complete len:206 (-) Transcript_23139:1840-2457(-)